MEIQYSFDKNGTRIDHTTPASRHSVTNPDSLNAGINHLDEHGYAVFSDVMAEEEISLNKVLLWKFLESIPDTQIRRNDPSTWSCGWPGSTLYGVVNNSGIGQSDFMWSVRSNRNVKRVYSQIWNTNDLLVSFDGCGLYRDWRYEPQWKTTTGWYHVDQNPINKPDRCCVQGFVALTNQNETTGGLIVFPQTHLRFEQIKNVTNSAKDFVMMPSTHPILDCGQAIGKLIHCQAGDLVLWDSRLVHCNTPALSIEERQPNEPVDLLRIVAYVSMSPIAFIRDQTVDQFREKRKLLAQNNCTLTHWSTELTKTSSTDGLPKVSLEKLDAYQHSLLIGTDVADE